MVVVARILGEDSDAAAREWSPPVHRLDPDGADLWLDQLVQQVSWSVLEAGEDVPHGYENDVPQGCDSSCYYQRRRVLMIVPDSLFDCAWHQQVLQPELVWWVVRVRELVEDVSQ